MGRNKDFVHGQILWLVQKIKGKKKITSEKTKLCTYEDEVYTLSVAKMLDSSVKKEIRVMRTSSAFKDFFI